MMFLALMRKKSSLTVKMTEVRIVADTYAWIELLIGSEKGKKAKEVRENAEILLMLTTKSCKNLHIYSRFHTSAVISRPYSD